MKNSLVFAEKYPELVKEWNASKNGSLTPDMVTPGSNKKVWWKCKKDHEWQTRVFKRSKRGDGCGYCSNKKVNKENCFATTNPEMVKKWHPTKNGSLTPHDFTAGSSKKAWWIDSFGHEWYSTIASQKKHGCPRCGYAFAAKNKTNTLLKRQIKLGNVLSKMYPKLAKEWHPTKNGDLTPDNITSGVKEKIWWKCPDCSFDWKCRLNERTRWKFKDIRQNRNPRYCPECTQKFNSKKARETALKKSGSLAKNYPGLVKEWHPTKNGDLTPYMITADANEKPWWKCEKGHEWDAAVGNRTSNNSKCPYCAKKLPSKNYNLNLLHPDIVKEWNYELNDKLPEEYTPSSKQKVWWNCKYNHPYEMQIQARTRKGQMQSCPEHKLERQIISYKKTILEKVGSISEKYPKLLLEWDWEKNKDNPNTVPISRVKPKYWWKCKRNHEWQAAVCKRTVGNGNGNGQNCPRCNNKTSHLEVRIYSELRFFFPNTIWQYPFHGGQLDLFIPDHDVAIEIDGFWHKNKEERDLKKDDQANNAGIKLIRIRDKNLKKIGRLHIYHDWQKCEEDFPTILNLVNILLNELKINNSKRNELVRYINNKKYVNEKFYLDTWANNTDPKPGHSLEERFPEVSKEWHPTANGNLTPADIPYSSHMRVYWLCKVHGQWQQTPNTRTNRKSGCEKCGNKRMARTRMIMAAEKHSVKDVPQLIKQWHPTKNTEFTPEMVSPGSSKFAWWKCKEGHEWKTKIYVIYKHLNEVTRLDIFTGCPDCYKNNRNEFADEIRKRKLLKSGSVLKYYPGLEKIWAKDNKFKPSELSQGSNKRVKIFCPKKHIVERTLSKISSRLSKTGNIYCNKCKAHFTLIS